MYFASSATPMETRAVVSLTLVTLYVSMKARYQRFLPDTCTSLVYVRPINYHPFLDELALSAADTMTSTARLML